MRERPLSKLHPFPQRLRHALMTWGEKFTKQECDVILQEAPLDGRGRIDIRRFASLVTRGAEDEDEQQD